jgi:pyruvate/2-oxoglutarate dehydrogenase complex dihydrolipoamide dehydrogenase (E3) component
MSKRYHTIIIGSGSGGMTVAVGLAGFGKDVAVIEANFVGGDCTNVGCVPSKTLIHDVNQADFVPEAVLPHVREKRDHLRDEETEYVKNLDKVDFFAGRAKLTGQHRIHVRLNDGGEEVLETQHIVIATGAKPRVIDIDGLPAERILTNESVFEQASAPAHLAIVGGGVIAMEMAFAFAKLGSKVSVIERNERIFSRMEPEASQILSSRLRDLGVNIYTHASPTRFAESNQTLTLEQGSTPIALENVDKVLLAAGRVPATANLGLEDVGVTFDERGIPTDAYGKTNISNIYAIGDVNPTSNFTHSANAQGRRLVPRLAFSQVFSRLPTFGSQPAYPSATFSDPEVATVGGTLEQLQQRYPAELIHTARYELANTDKGYTESLEQGVVIIHAMRLTGRILGATIVAPKASEMISLLTFAMANNHSLYKLSQLVFPYPTLSEGIKKAADSFMFATLPKLPQELGAYVRYRWRKPQAEVKQKGGVARA